MKRENKTTTFHRFLTGSGLPLFLLSATLVYEVFLLVIVFAPDSTSAWGGFAREFKQWCFNFDPESGALLWLQVVIMLLEPIFITSIALYLWKDTLKNLRSFSAWFSQWRIVFMGTVTGVLVIGGLFLYGKPEAGFDAELPFPGERIRTHITLPEFSFVDQKGNPFRMKDTRGRVVLVTGVYAACSSTCPQILIETKLLLDSLPKETLKNLDVVALSLSPEYDTTAMMDGITTGYGFTYPQFRYLNGEPETINEVVKNLGFSKSIDPETGIINHSNLFLVVDGQGKIAYRLTLDSRHKDWLREAVVALTAEVGNSDLVASIR